MSDAHSTAWPYDDYEGSTTPGGEEGVRWEVVARTPGLMPAQIMAGRLQAEGIPAQAWQEAAGRALGLTVGILGTGYVSVPAEHVETAAAILSRADDALADEPAEDEETDQWWAAD